MPRRRRGHPPDWSARPLRQAAVAELVLYIDLPLAIDRNTYYPQISMPANHNEIEKRLWEAADRLRANSKLKASPSTCTRLASLSSAMPISNSHWRKKNSRDQRPDAALSASPDYQARGVMYLPPESRYANLLNLPEGTDVAPAINNAMKAVEAENESLKDVLPETRTPSSAARSSNSCETLTTSHSTRAAMSLARYSSSTSSASSQ